jgi:ubiquinone/menaquinone biosynthesis C-methylase UbiE
MPRLAPGGEWATLRALSAVPLPPRNARVLDLGCGTGAQTMILAQRIQGTIIALDNHAPFLDLLRDRSSREVTSGRIECLQKDMHHLDFADASFDLLWAEGSIYVIGFEKGLGEARRLLRKGGCAVFSDMNWRTSTPPQEIHEFFHAEYPGMLSVRENLDLIARNDAQVLDTFPLSVQDHLEPYYVPLQRRVELFRNRYRGDDTVLQMLDGLQHEITLYGKYSACFGYTFYVMQYM